MFKAQNFKYFKIVLFLLLFFSSLFSVYSPPGSHNYDEWEKSSSSGESSSSSDDEEFTKAYKKLFINPKELSFSCSGDANLTTQEKKSEFGELLSLIKQIFLSLCFLIFFFGQNPVFFVILFSFITSILIVIMLKTSDFNGNAGATIKKIAPILGLIIFIFLCVAIVPVAETFVKNIPTMVVLILSITAAAIFSPMLVPKSKEGNNYILVFAFIFVFYFANCGIVFLISDQFSFVFPFYDGITKGIFSLTEIIVFIFLVILFLTAFKLVFKSKSGFEDSMGLNNEPTLGTAKKVAKAVGKGIGDVAKGIGDSWSGREKRKELEKKNNIIESFLEILSPIGKAINQLQEIVKNLNPEENIISETDRIHLNRIIEFVMGDIKSLNNEVKKFNNSSEEKFKIFEEHWKNFETLLVLHPSKLITFTPIVIDSLINYLYSVSESLSIKISKEDIETILYSFDRHLIEDIKNKLDEGGEKKKKTDINECVKYIYNMFISESGSIKDKDSINQNEIIILIESILSSLERDFGETEKIGRAYEQLKKALDSFSKIDGKNIGSYYNSMGILVISLSYFFEQIENKYNLGIHNLELFQDLLSKIKKETESEANLIPELQNLLDLLEKGKLSSYLFGTSNYIDISEFHQFNELLNNLIKKVKDNNIISILNDISNKFNHYFGDLKGKQISDKQKLVNNFLGEINLGTLLGFRNYLNRGNNDKNN